MPKPSMAQVDTENSVETRYKIGDVCRIADVQPYVLRYWESEFAALATDRTQSGPRTYSAHELRIIEQIKRLLYDEGYTIAGAKKRLDSEALAASRAEVIAAPEKAERGKRSSSKSDTAPVQALRTDKTQPVLLELQQAASAAPAPDPRLAHAVAELKDILKILSS